MMTNDQLTRRERIRLEAFAQACAMTAIIPPVKDQNVMQRPGPATVKDAEDVLFARAYRIEKFLLEADNQRGDA